MSDSVQPYGQQPTRLLCPRGFSRQEYWSQWEPDLLYLKWAGHLLAFSVEKLVFSSVASSLPIH